MHRITLNGFQVDEDNFIVNANGLVGIGTSVPSEFLDVRGTAKVVGLVTASDVFVSGVATITEIQVGTVWSGVKLGSRRRRIGVEARSSLLVRMLTELKGMKT